MAKISPLYRFPFLFSLSGLLRFGKKSLSKEIKNLIGKNKKVFDAACGYGRAKDILDPSCEYRGIDLNEIFIRMGREKFGRNIWLQDAVWGPDYPESDVIIIMDLLHHVSRKETKIIITKALKASPLVIIVEPSFLGLAKEQSVFGRIVNWIFTTLDQDGINSQKIWYSETEYKKEFETFFGLRIDNITVNVKKIGMSLLATYRADNKNAV